MNQAQSVREYDVTVKLRLADYGRPPGGKGEPMPLEQVVSAAVGCMLRDLAGNTTARAATLSELTVQACDGKA